MYLIIITLLAHPSIPEANPAKIQYTKPSNRYT